MKFGIAKFLLALSGWPTSFDFWSHLVNEAIIVFGLTWWIQHTMTTKHIRVVLNVTRIMRPIALYWQFCWDLVPSKLTTHRHYRLLRTRSWSHRQSKLICWQLRKKVLDQLDTFVDKQLLPVEGRIEPFSELNWLKINIRLMHSWSKCSCLTQG